MNTIIKSKYFVTFRIPLINEVSFSFQPKNNSVNGVTDDLTHNKLTCPCSHSQSRIVRVLIICFLFLQRVHYWSCLFHLWHEGEFVTNWDGGTMFSARFDQKVLHFRLDSLQFSSIINHKQITLESRTYDRGSERYLNYINHLLNQNAFTRKTLNTKRLHQHGLPVHLREP